MQAVRIIKSSKERSQDEDAKKDSPDKQPPPKKKGRKERQQTNKTPPYPISLPRMFACAKLFVCCPLKNPTAYLGIMIYLACQVIVIWYSTDFCSSPDFVSPLQRLNRCVLVLFHELANILQRCVCVTPVKWLELTGQLHMETDL